jgi:MarR family transcriptional regulator, 2-MHQ and catechol-resistance regulon repressor
MAPTTARPRLDPAVVDHPNLTTMGLFAEAHAGLGALLERELETGHGLSGQRFEVLVRLVRSPGQRLRMSDLAAQTTLSASGLTRVVDRLVREGLVERAACPSDRRGSFAVLTATGERQILAALPAHVAQITELLEGAFAPADLERFSALLRQLRDSVNPDAERASRSASCDPA